MALILLVDDSEIERHLADEILRATGDHKLFHAINGVHALETLENQPIDLIVTDLKMPEMTGLELLEQVQNNYQSIPLIVMTSRGSEEAAIAALDGGAAGYLPKKHLSTTLMPTVDQVLANKKRQLQFNSLLHSMDKLEVQFKLENETELVPTTVSYLQQCLKQMGIGEESLIIRSGIALEEAMINAMIHGNLEISSELRGVDDEAFKELIAVRKGLENYRNRRVTVSTTIDSEQAKFEISDEGLGFDVTKLPDPTDPENLIKPSGRGVLLMRSFMDEVSYNQLGNKVTMILKSRNSNNQNVDQIAQPLFQLA